MTRRRLPPGPCSEFAAAANAAVSAHTRTAGGTLGVYQGHLDSRQEIFRIERVSPDMDPVSLQLFAMAVQHPVRRGAYDHGLC